MVIDELIAVLGYDLKGEANLSRFNAGLERAASLARTMSAAIVAAGAVASAALFTLGKGVIETSAKFEGFETSLQTIEGSAEKAKASMDWVSKFATKTPYDIAGVTEAFIKLKAYGLDPTDGTLATLGDTASSMNKPLSAAVEMFADAATFEFERLKEFGLRAQQKGNQVTFSWTKDGKTLTKVVKKNGDEIRKFILENLGERFNGAMIRQSKTWNGLMSNLGDTWQMFQKRIGDAGFFELVKSRLGRLMDTIGKLDENGTLDRWAKRLNDVLSAGFTFLDRVITALVKDIGTIGDLLDKAGEKIADFLRWISGGKIDLDSWQALVAFFGVLLAVLNPAWVALVGLVYAIDDFLTWIRGGKSKLGDFIAKLKELGISFDSVGDAISSSMKVVSDWFSSVNWTEEGKALGKTLVDGIGNALSKVSEALGTIDWWKLGTDIEGSIDFSAIGKAWYDALKAQFEFMGGLKDGLVKALAEADWKSVGDKWVKALKATIDLVKGVFDGLTKDIGEGVKNWFNEVDWKEVGEKIKTGILNAIVAIPAALIALFTGEDYSDVGKRLGEGILSGLETVGGAIKEWFAGILPAWATDFFDWKTEKDGSLKGKATEEGRRRAQMERLTKPANQNIANPLDQVREGQATQERRARFAQWGDAAENARINTMRVSGQNAVQTVVNDNADRSVTTNTSVSLTVQQIQQAASAAGKAVQEKVSSALSKVPSHPARTTPSPTF